MLRETRCELSFHVSAYKPNLDFLSIKAGREHCVPRTLKARTPLPDCLMLPEAFQCYKYRWKSLRFAGSWLFPQADSLAWCWLLFWLLGSMNPLFCFTLWFLTRIFQNYLRGEGSWMPTSEKNPDSEKTSLIFPESPMYLLELFLNFKWYIYLFSYF